MKNHSVYFLYLRYSRHFVGYPVPEVIINKNKNKYH